MSGTPARGRRGGAAEPGGGGGGVGAADAGGGRRWAGRQDTRCLRVRRGPPRAGAGEWPPIRGECGAVRAGPTSAVHRPPLTVGRGGGERGGGGGGRGGGGAG